MAQVSTKSVVVVGAGITGLCIAVAAQASGHAVTLVARDKPEATASGIAAGMIAPALESMHDADSEGFSRLSHARDAWLDMIELWPQAVQEGLRTQADMPSLLVWQGAPGPDERHILACHVTESLGGKDLAALGVAATFDGGLRLSGDGLVDAAQTLRALQDHFVATGGRRIAGTVLSLDRNTVWINGDEISCDEVIVAAGYNGARLAESVPSLAVLTPVKGHLLDLAGQGRHEIIRSSEGYLADQGDSAKFGATMQFGRYDVTIEADIVAELKARARSMLPNLEGLDQAVPRVGIRASSPDGWPMIGRDGASGVLVATAMRRNGFVFAPLAARMMLDVLAGRAPPEAPLYDPNRFS